MNIWYPIGLVVAFVALFAIRGTVVGKREARRLEALFHRVSSCACPVCGLTYGSEVRPLIALTFDDDEALPRDLAERRRISTWRIPCPRCRGVALLAEDFPDVFEILRLKQQNVDA